MPEPGAVGRITTRRTIGVAAGLLALAACVVLVRSFTAKPAVTVTFVRYAHREAAVLTFTNQGRSTLLLRCMGWEVLLVPEDAATGQKADAVHLLPSSFIVPPWHSTQLCAVPLLPPSTPLFPAL